MDVGVIKFLMNFMETMNINIGVYLVIVRIHVHLVYSQPGIKIENPC